MFRMFRTSRPTAAFFHSVHAPWLGIPIPHHISTNQSLSCEQTEQIGQFSSYTVLNSVYESIQATSDILADRGHAVAAMPPTQTNVGIPLSYSIQCATEFGDGFQTGTAHSFIAGGAQEARLLEWQFQRQLLENSETSSIHIINDEMGDLKFFSHGSSLSVVALNNPNTLEGNKELVRGIRDYAQPDAQIYFVESKKPLTRLPMVKVPGGPWVIDSQLLTDGSMELMNHLLDGEEIIDLRLDGESGYHNPLGWCTGLNGAILVPEGLPVELHRAIADPVKDSGQDVIAVPGLEKGNVLPQIFHAKQNVLKQSDNADPTARSRRGHNMKIEVVKDPKGETKTHLFVERKEHSNDYEFIRKLDPTAQPGSQQKNRPDVDEVVEVDASRAKYPGM